MWLVLIAVGHSQVGVLDVMVVVTLSYCVTLCVCVYVSTFSIIVCVTVVLGTLSSFLYCLKPLYHSEAILSC
jgi:hypothetical protein